MEVFMTLEAARKNVGYSQNEAAKLFGVHYQTIAAWERDNSKMPYSMVEKIPAIYKVPTECIFFGDRNEFIRNIRGAHSTEVHKR